MNQPTFNYVEDYVEFIGGYRTAQGKVLGLFDTVPSPLSLARYDVSIVISLAEQTGFSNKGYTDKQAELAKKIVAKYRRQLLQHNPPVHLPEELTNFRLGIRTVDRSKTLALENNCLVMRFPFDTKLIEYVKKHSKEGQGAVSFNYDNKVWRLALTESNLNFAVTVAKNYEFTIADEVQQLYNRLLESEKTEYKIELVSTDSGFEITNANDSLTEYINENLGGFGPDNLLLLADNSSVLGYTVSEELTQRIKKEYADIAHLVLARTVKLDKTKWPEKAAMDVLVDYAGKVNRLPVYVYETGLPQGDTDRVKYLNRTKESDVKSKLMVSMTSLMIGSKKESWRTNAEKIIIIE